MDKDHILSEGLERVADAARFLGISRSSVYKLIRSGQLPSVKLGTSRRVPIRAVWELAAARLILPPREEPG